MPKTIVFNKTHIVDNTNNSTLVYEFPISANFDNHEVALESVSVNYSWFNISSALNNNQITYRWYEPNANPVNQDYTITFEDGLYEVADINARIQFEMIKNGHYLINPQNQNVFYFEFLVNVSRFAIQINTFPVPTASQFNSGGGANPSTGAGDYLNWKKPVADSKAGTSAWKGYPPSNYNPIVTLPASNNFHKLLGFTAGFATEENSGNNTNKSYLSSVAPEIQPNTNVYISLANVENEYANPSTIIHNLISTGSAFGSTILDRPNEFAFNKLTRGQYAQLRLQLLGSDFTPLKINDPDMVIVLLIKEI
jgi:hypothetical protein